MMMLETGISLANSYLRLLIHQNQLPPVSVSELLPINQPPTSKGMGMQCAANSLREADSFFFFPFGEDFDSQKLQLQEKVAAVGQGGGPPSIHHISPPIPLKRVN
ncbi:Hypothetical predicted protein [Prunus dulcis]|uniref:Uncharacterized protein n=1 Tax=Prunus dulcis TaxID=3755 RepID=A0A5E4EJI9_PRUDU|nr:hypothetical protein L3X38_006422 [Prunus dulcis]VVA14781.1 Hypothetical predicted protein [Prunus dulcis]